MLIACAFQNTVTYTLIDSSSFTLTLLEVPTFNKVKGVYHKDMFSMVAMKICFSHLLLVFSRLMDLTVIFTRRSSKFDLNKEVSAVTYGHLFCLFL